MKDNMKNLLLFLTIFFALEINLYAQENRVIILQPKNLSKDSQLDWISQTFSKSIQLELRKDKFKADILDSIPSSISPNEYLILSAFKKFNDRIIFFINFVRKGSSTIDNSSDMDLIDSISIAFIPDIIYETKTYVSRLARLYITSNAKISSAKFNPVSYKFSSEKMTKLSEILGRVQSNVNYEDIIMNPAEQDGWLRAGIDKMKKGEISYGLSFISRYISKICPEFSSEEELLKNDKINLAMDILKITLPGESKERSEALKLFVISQFFGDFSENEIKNLSSSIEKDRFLWMAMKKLGDIYFARGDYRSSLTYFRDYISTTNEGIGFIMNISKPISLVEELSRGF